MNFNLITRIAAVIISLLSVIFLTTVLASETPDGGLIVPFIYLSYVTFGLAIATVLFYTVVNLASKKGKELKNTFLSIGTFILIILISYILADGTAIPLKEGGEVSASTSKWVSTGIISFYILAAIAIILTVFSGFIKIKK
jgi:hypothetical protein